MLERLLLPPFRLGWPREWPRRLVAEAIFHLVRSDGARRVLPNGSPPWCSVCSQFTRWRGGTARSGAPMTRLMLRRLAAA